MSGNNYYKGYVQIYPCKCSGGNFCYIVRYPNGEMPLSYTTRGEALKELEKLREKEKCESCQEKEEKEKKNRSLLQMHKV